MTGYICCTCGEGSLSAPLPRWCPACGTYNDPAEEAADMGGIVEIFSRLIPGFPEEDSHDNPNPNPESK